MFDWAAPSSRTSECCPRGRYFRALHCRWSAAAGPPHPDAALVRRLLAPATEGVSPRESTARIRAKDGSRSPNGLGRQQLAVVSCRCQPACRHRGAHHGGAQRWTDGKQSLHAARFSVTTGRCRRPPWKVSSHANRTPGLPLTSVSHAMLCLSVKISRSITATLPCWPIAPNRGCIPFRQHDGSNLSHENWGPWSSTRFSHEWMVSVVTKNSWAVCSRFLPCAAFSWRMAIRSVGG